MQSDRSGFKAFVAHGFQASEQHVAKQLISIFENNEVQCTTGEPPEVGPISEKVMRRIREADALIAIVQARKAGRTSRWVDQEIGYALGCEKVVLRFINEDATSSTKGIEGESNYVTFKATSEGLVDDSKLQTDISQYLKDAKKKIEDRRHTFLQADRIFRDPSLGGFADVLRNSKTQMIVAGIAVQPIADLLQPAIAKKLQNDHEFMATIVLSDPCAPEPRERESDEKLGTEKGQMARDVAKIALRYLTEPKLTEAIESGRLSILFFPRYPTMAVAVFDDELYAYFYSYHCRGTASPMLHFRNFEQNHCAEFFWNHLTEVVKDSYPLPVDTLRQF